MTGLGIVLDEPIVHLVMTEVNGYKNVFGHDVFARLDDAVAARDRALASGKYDCAYVVSWHVDTGGNIR